MILADAVCPRCNGTFHCGAADASPCECTTLALTEATLAGLRSRYDSCLCIACLIELHAAQPAQA